MFGLLVSFKNLKWTSFFKSQQTGSRPKTKNGHISIPWAVKSKYILQIIHSVRELTVAVRR
jgi:hypothetical protein